MAKAWRLVAVLAALSVIVCLASAESVQQTTASSVEQPSPKVGVVGAGIGGAISAFLLRRLLGPTAEIFVLAHGPIGGRTQTFMYDDQVWELGASIIFEENYYIRRLADEMGLKRVPPGSRLNGTQNKLFNIFNGQDYVFQESEWQAVTLARLLWRYGLSYVRFLTQPKLMFTRFKKIYSIQAGGNAFERPDDLLKWVDLYDLTQKTMQQHLVDTLGSSPEVLLFADEMVASINRVNYNQDNNLNAMAGMVSMLPTVDSRIFAIEGGNRLLPEALLKNASVVMLSGAAVADISQDDSGLFHVELANGSQGPPLLDAVLIACPLEQSQLKLSLPKAPVIPPRKYQVTNTFYVRAGSPILTFNPSPPGLIMSTGSAPTHFSAISPAKAYPDGTFLYKLFLDGSDDLVTLDGLFENYTIVGQHDWHAYPRFSPPESFAPFQLAPGLYYGNALETAASAMEIAGIAACNNVLLAGQYLSRLGFDLQMSLEQTCRAGAGPMDTEL